VVVHCQHSTFHKKDKGSISFFCISQSSPIYLIMFINLFAIASLAVGALGHGDHEGQLPIAGPHKALWYNTLPGDGGTQVCLARLLLYSN